MLAVNNIVKKKNISAKILAIILCCIFTYAVRFADHKDRSLISNKETSSHQTSDIEYLIGLIILISIILLKFYAINQFDQRKAMDLTYTFIVDHFTEEHPEIKPYVHVLKNTQTLNLLTNFIYNELGEKEQKRIMTIVKSFDNKDLEHKNNYEFTRIQHDIMEILYEYSAQHPEYVKNIHNILENANKTYQFNQHEKTR